MMRSATNRDKSQRLCRERVRISPERWRCDELLAPISYKRVRKPSMSSAEPSRVKITSRRVPSYFNSVVLRETHVTRNSEDGQFEKR